MESNIPKKFLKPYESKDTEDRIYKRWEESGFFNPDNLPDDRKETYTIMLPPPNVTGVLHMGHALNATIQDILIRQKRMMGLKTLWLPGTDHAGIATQNVVEKKLKKEKITRHDLGSEKFLEKVWEWKEEYGDKILSQLRQLGASCDWSRTRFTMDPEYAEAVKEAFLKYHKQGLIYQGERVINWCTRCQTSLSDLELEYEEAEGKLWFIKYPVKGSGQFIVVATTRPETMLGDTGVAVHPEDSRYKDLVGKTVILPIVGREIPIVADDAIDKEFGTGAVKVTPGHSIIDSEIGERHNLPIEKIINSFGKMEESAGAQFAGLKTKDAREKVIEELKAANLIEKEEEHAHRISTCYRCHHAIEPQASKQWFVKMNDPKNSLAKKALDAIKEGRIVFNDKKWEKVYTDWLLNVRDWCISRQIWWGHKVPLPGETDVLDTWFSSALWPLATLGWPNEKAEDLRDFYPTQVLSTARDIINLWVSRMIFSGMEFMGDVPFTHIIIHPTVMAKDGRRMSKSLGTGVDPIDLVEKYGADATRFGLIYQMMGGQDIKFNEAHLAAGKKFANKLWNIARFILAKTDGNIAYDPPKNLSGKDEEFVKKLGAVLRLTAADIDAFHFGRALHTLYDFVWHDLADEYIEYSKGEDGVEVGAVLSYTLVTILKLLHPFMPFITEEVWGLIHEKSKSKFLMIESWPKSISH